ncbi:MAG: AraC family transcriptional regulator [Endozoicomonas sp.]
MKQISFPEDIPQPAIVVPRSYPDGQVLGWHQHDFAQLVYACSGVMTVETAENLWVIPPQRALWVPQEVPHKVSMHGQAEMRNLYVRADAFDELPEKSCVLTISPLMRELILHLACFPFQNKQIEEASRMIHVTMDQLRRANEVSFYLPMASDARLKSVCEALLLNPDDRRSLSEWAQRANVSSRSLSRLFRADLGMSFVEYRQQARLLGAIKLLAKGQPVSTVAMDVGFSSLSAFNRLFKKNIGTTPGHFFN